MRTVGKWFILFATICLFGGFVLRIQATEEVDTPLLEEEEELLVPIQGYKVFDFKIALGGYSTTIVNETNGVFEWGILTNANEPRKLVFLDANNEPMDFTAETRKYDLLDMACGGYYCLALIQDASREQSIYGWGRVPLSNENYVQPVLLNQFSDLLKEHRVKKMSAGHEHALFVTTERQLVVWGEGKSGQLGVEGLRETAQPVLVTGLSDIHVKSACGGGHHSMILTTDGKIYATGWNTFGQLGLGVDRHTQVFEHVIVPEKITKISCGGDHSLAITKTGGIYAWGWGENGQLGQGTMDNSNTPQRVSGTELFISAVASPYAHNLALTKSHEVTSFHNTTTTTTTPHIQLNSIQFKWRETIIPLRFVAWRNTSCTHQSLISSQLSPCLNSWRL
eukprot:TRINITY_DN1718_c0_g1_i1.p2 TRINITY_DN1718_c0_g1~~TRINITY_DN1718_c0_g1_i1.p2  ORF type:complete len:394 (-),score=81.75 TRINITY_DN1718_c0_g1_i1:1180-2361(-)